MDYKKLWEQLHKSFQRSNKVDWKKRDILDKMNDMEITEARASFLPKEENIAEVGEQK